MKKILVLCGTGAIGTYLVPELLSMGYKVDVVSVDDVISHHINLRYIKLDLSDFYKVKELVKGEYNAIIDLFVYRSVELFKPYADLFLNSSDQYIFFSSYRVYAGDYPIKETSPRLFDLTKDDVLLKSGDYCIYKAQCEDYLKNSGKKNWTILRPSITFSKRRFQLVTLEADVFMWRVFNHKTVILPREAMDIQGTLTWAGDSGRLIARLIFNPYAYGEIFTVSTSEHHTWKEMAQIYNEIKPFSYICVDAKTYCDLIIPDNIFIKQQLVYDRCLNRVVDNTKILNATGMKQEQLASAKQSLAFELRGYIADSCSPFNKNFDDYISKMETK